MPQLTPVSHDPFTDIKKIPVEHDPFMGAFGVGSPAEESSKPSNVVSNMLGSIVSSLATLPKRAIENSQYSMDTGYYDPRPVLEAAMLPMGTGAVAGVPVRGAETVLGSGPIRAYHGSPHDFDKFDVSKIGTGQGAQTYGRGLYFAEDENVARGYRNTLSDTQMSLGLPWKRTVIPDTSDFVERTASRFVTQTGSIDSAIKYVYNEMQNHPGTFPDILAKLKTWQSRKAVPKFDTSGKMYEVNINADPTHFLDLDKSLANASQPAALRDMLHSDANLDTIRPLLRDPGFTSEAAQRGIPGIKYLDQGSRDAGHGSRNYAVFDDSIVDIIRKYGLAGLSVLPPATAAFLSERIRPVEHNPFEDGS